MKQSPAYLNNEFKYPCLFNCRFCKRVMWTIKRVNSCGKTRHYADQFKFPTEESFLVRKPEEKTFMFDVDLNLILQRQNSLTRHSEQPLKWLSRCEFEKKIMDGIEDFDPMCQHEYQLVKCLLNKNCSIPSNIFIIKM